MVVVKKATKKELLSAYRLKEEFQPGLAANIK
jgi:hypothetical protein